MLIHEVDFDFENNFVTKDNSIDQDSTVIRSNFKDREE